MLSVPCLESTAVVHVGRTEMEVPCSCGIDRQIHRYNNPDVLIVISYVIVYNHTVSVTCRPHPQVATVHMSCKMTICCYCMLSA